LVTLVGQDNHNQKRTKTNHEEKRMICKVQCSRCGHISKVCPVANPKNKYDREWNIEIHTECFRCGSREVFSADPVLAVDPNSVAGRIMARIEQESVKQ